MELNWTLIFASSISAFITAIVVTIGQFISNRAMQKMFEQSRKKQNNNSDAKKLDT